jgi:hypothetical protein
VVTAPSFGPAGTNLTITGAGFAARESVKVKYDTGQSSSTQVSLCSATVAGDGTFSCPATVPADAGRAGTHTIIAKGDTSGTVAKTLFLRTT